jgi:hypothetical protein
MRTLKTGEAASFLNVSPNTLRTWEQRFGYPVPQRSPGSHRLYAYAEIAALRDALGQGLSVSSAVSVARDSLRVDVSGLVYAMAWLKGSRAEEIMSASLALGSVRDAIERLLFPALRELLERKGPRSGPFAFGISWANDWLRRAERIVIGDEPRTRVLIGDASDPLMSLDGPHVRALEFFCARAGANVVSLPVRAVAGIDDIQAALRPQAMVIAGRGASADDVSDWTSEVRSRAGRIPLALYRRQAERSATMTGAVQLGTDSPSEAQHQIFTLIRTDGHRRRSA